MLEAEEHSAETILHQQDLVWIRLKKDRCGSGMLLGDAPNGPVEGLCKDKVIEGAWIPVCLEGTRQEDKYRRVWHRHSPFNFEF